MLSTALALLVVTTGCTAIPKDPPVGLRAGYDTRDGSQQVWPARGGRAADPQATTAVAAAVADWRSPLDDRVHLPSSGILWLGDVGGTPLALVAANVPGRAASWLLQLTGRGDRFQIDRASEYTDPGYLVYSDVLPAYLPDGRRYLTSSRVERLLGPNGKALELVDGLSALVEVPRCAAVTVTARLRPSESLPNGKTADKIIDLGTGVPDPRYPLVNDEANSGGPALRGLDTCALAAKTGPVRQHPTPNQQPGGARHGTHLLADRQDHQQIAGRDLAATATSPRSSTSSPGVPTRA